MSAVSQFEAYLEREMEEALDAQDREDEIWRETRLLEKPCLGDCPDREDACWESYGCPWLEVPMMTNGGSPVESLYVQRIEKAKACPHGPCLKCARRDVGQGCIL